MGTVTAEWMEIALAVLLVLVGQITLWIRFKTLVEIKVSTMEKAISKHDQSISHVKRSLGEKITMQQHDKIQSDCRQGIYADIDNSLRSMDLMREDIKENNKKLDTIALMFEGIKSDLKYLRGTK